MGGTYTLQGIGAGHTGHAYSLNREDVDRLIGARTDGPYRVTCLVTRRSVKVTDAKPLTAEQVAWLSNES